jgi:hypothetical protein
VERKMNATSARRLTAERPLVAEQALLAGLYVFAVYHLALAIFMAAAPHAFFKAIGPFGSYNPHDIRDVASFTAALGVGFLVAIRVPSWRVPVLAVTTAQFALHSVNHLIDIGKARPSWTGYFDFGSLLLSTLLLAWMLRVALARSTAAPAAAAPIPLAKPDPSPQRSVT